MLEKAFRSIIDIPKNGRPTIDREELLENFRSFSRSRVRNEQEAYKKIYYRIRDHFKRYVEVPSMDRLLDHFKEEPGCEDVLVALESVREEKPYIGGNYKDVLREIKDEQDKEALREILNDTNEISVMGIKEGKKKLKGFDDALDFISSKVRELRQFNQDFKTEAEITDTREIQAAKEEYEEREKNQLNTLGIYTGLDEIDDSMDGIKHTELMIVGAYTAQGKTTFSINVLYRALITGWDSLLVTLEMTLPEMRTMLYVLHTSSMCFWVGTKFEKLVGKMEYNDAINGRLSPELKEFYYAAMDDLENNDAYGKLYIYQPDTSVTTIEEITIKCLEINSELKTKGRMLEFLVVDYIRLLGVDPRTGSRDDRTNLNNIIKGLKRLCLTFNNGQGLRCLSPHQIKREGYERALGNGGIYLLSDLSDTSEIEKSADIVITLFMDDALRKSHMFKICGLKDRRNSLFRPFEACANLATKYIYSKSDISESDLANFGDNGLSLED